MAHRRLVTTELSGSGTTVVTSGAGVLHSVTVATPGTISLFDNTEASGRKIAALGPSSGRFVFNAPFEHGLALSVSGSAVFSVEVRERRT